MNKQAPTKHRSLNLERITHSLFNSALSDTAPSLLAASDVVVCVMGVLAGDVRNRTGVVVSRGKRGKRCTAALSRVCSNVRIAGSARGQRCELKTQGRKQRQKTQKSTQGAVTTSLLGGKLHWPLSLPITYEGSKTNGKTNNQGTVKRIMDYGTTVQASYVQW